MPVIDLDQVPGSRGSGYPPPHNAGFEGRTTWRLGDAAGLTQFGANRVELAPGAMSSQRHWHEAQDEFLVVTQGICTLVDDDGAHDLHPGDCAAFPAGQANGHHIVNRTEAPCAFVVVGTRTPTETAWYSDIDMMARLQDGRFIFTRKDGTPIEGENE